MMTPTNELGKEFATYFKNAAGVDRVTVVDRPDKQCVTLRLDIDIYERNNSALFKQIEQACSTVKEAIEVIKIDTDTLKALRTLKQYLAR